MLRLTTHQHVPSNATCDPGKIIVLQLLKIAGKSVIITKLDCIHLNLETYRSGRNENDSKSFCLEIGTWVRIPPSPPSIMVSLDRMRVKAHPIGLFRGFSGLDFS